MRSRVVLVVAAEVADKNYFEYQMFSNLNS